MQRTRLGASSGLESIALGLLTTVNTLSYVMTSLNYIKLKDMYRHKESFMNSHTSHVLETDQVGADSELLPFELPYKTT
ncbi:hypothetical protein TNCV_3310591 [Trichonephila clavipes]|nr:hypothetical protein TNCV_3310591 [Trichonephila clavipes]